VGDHHGRFSDINVFCVLRQLTPRELGDGESVFRWWREKGNPSPLLMSQDEVARSTDCFPIEFRDMKERRRVLAGADVVADLAIGDAFYRAQVEHELRAKLLRLRQKAAGVLSDKGLLLGLLVDSISTFCTLFRHALVLAGSFSRSAGGRRSRQAVQIGRRRSMRCSLREGRKPRDVDPPRLFEQYQKDQRGGDAVDRLEDEEKMKIVLIVLAVLLVVRLVLESSWSASQRPGGAARGINGTGRRWTYRCSAARTDSNLVATVKGYAAQEKGVFESIANARAALGGAHPQEDPGQRATGQRAGAIAGGGGKLPEPQVEREFHALAG
jgi:hypothetical protein